MSRNDDDVLKISGEYLRLRAIYNDVSVRADSCNEECCLGIGLLPMVGSMLNEIAEKSNLIPYRVNIDFINKAFNNGTNTGCLLADLIFTRVKDDFKQMSDNTEFLKFLNLNDGHVAGCVVGYFFSIISLEGRIIEYPFTTIDEKNRMSPNHLQGLPDVRTVEAITRFNPYIISMLSYLTDYDLFWNLHFNHYKYNNSNDLYATHAAQLITKAYDRVIHNICDKYQP